MDTAWEDHERGKCPPETVEFQLEQNMKYGHRTCDEDMGEIFQEF